MGKIHPDTIHPKVNDQVKNVTSSDYDESSAYNTLTRGHVLPKTIYRDKDYEGMTKEEYERRHGPTTPTD